MDFENRGHFPANWTMGFDKTGRELIVVVAKITFDMPAQPGAETGVAAEQAPLITSDVFAGEPAFTAVLYESDFAHRKPFCDVVLNGAAYAPQGRACRSLKARLKVGPVDKLVRVVGNRYYAGPWSDVVTEPEPFTRIPVTYGSAYGGFERDPDKPGEVLTYPPNPVGTGYYPISRRFKLAGKRLPNLERPDEAVSSPVGKYMPVAFGPVGRNFPERTRFCGTYDQQWLDDQAPFLPPDFDYRYFQCAPADQQMPYITGGEEVRVENLDETGSIWFALPRKAISVLFVPYAGKQTTIKAVADTLIIEPDLHRFTITWRASLSLSRDCFEIRRVIIGEPDRAWYSSRPAWKTHYRSIQEFIEAQRRR